MNRTVYVDVRMKSKIDSLVDMSNGETICLMVRFKDVDDAFFFNSDYELQEFMHQQLRERFLDKELRKGYFDYINENNNTLRYYVKSKKGRFVFVNEECIA